MAKGRLDEQHSRKILLIVGIFILTIVLYQNIILDLPYFYALFSLGMFIVLLALYNTISTDNLFGDWRGRDIVFFSGLLLLSCVLIDHAGMRLGYWEYPHYDTADDLRKYILEWAIALLYHMVSLLIGIQLFKRFFLHRTTAFFMGMLAVVTPVGFLTESLNLHVESWKVLTMPLSNMKIGDFFVVFQTLGYWLMALIPYMLYLSVDILVRKRGMSQKNFEKAGI
jgi:hypothetical protein